MMFKEFLTTSKLPDFFSFFTIFLGRRATFKLLVEQH